MTATRTCPNPLIHKLADAPLQPLADLYRAAIDVDEIANIVRDHADLTVAEQAIFSALRAAVRALGGKEADSRKPLPGVRPEPSAALRPQRPKVREINVYGPNHWDNCPEGAPDPVRWVCEFDHWIAWDIPPAMGDRCPIVDHDANSDGRCYGRLSRPECICQEAGR